MGAGRLRSVYDGRTILARDGSQQGVVTSSRQICRMEGCNGVRLSVKWTDGHRTYPCSRGVGEKPDGKLVIL